MAISEELQRKLRELYRLKGDRKEWIAKYNEAREACEDAVRAIEEIEETLAKIGGIGQSQRERYLLLDGRILRLRWLGMTRADVTEIQPES